MKKIIFLLILLINFLGIKAQLIDSITDIRDSHIYKIVKIGLQWWMAENLKVGYRIDGTQNASDNGIIEKYCYNNSDSLCNIYGGLYQWNETMDYFPPDTGNSSVTYGICPLGWNLPSSQEWTELINYLGGNAEAGGKMKETGTMHWPIPNDEATNESGFTAVPGGCRYNDGFYNDVGSWAYLWSATGDNWETSSYIDLPYYNSGVFLSYNEKIYGYSVRCLRDSNEFSFLVVTDTNKYPVSELNFNINNTTEKIIIINTSARKSINIFSIRTNESTFELSKSSAILSPGDSVHLLIKFNTQQSGKFSDSLFIGSDDPYNYLVYIPLVGTIPEMDSIIDLRDGQVYNIVKIGQQWWMQENLNIGTIINDSLDAFDDGFVEKYCYGNDINNCIVYGGLYQWDEMMDYNPSDNGNPSLTQGICPIGWYLPTDDEWKELEIYLGMSQVDADERLFRGTFEGGKLKETGFIHWVSPNTGATNESGFTALPSGYRLWYGGDFFELNYNSYFWSSTENDTDRVWRRRLDFNRSTINRVPYYKESGYSVRCLKDTDYFGFLSVTDTGLNLISILFYNNDQSKEEVIIINTGAGRTIHISSIYNNNSAFFLNKSSSNLLPGDSIHITIVFNPSFEGIYLDTIFIQSDDPYKPLIIIPLVGTYTLGKANDYVINESLSLLPNPFTLHTTLIFNNSKGYQYKLYIMDLSGKVCRIVDNITTSEYVLEKGDLKQGLYFIELRGPNIYRGKIIIE